jgi:hypothetical protein
MGTHLSWLGSIYTVPASTLAKMRLSAADLIADGSFILISAGIMNLLCVTFTGYNPVQNLIQRFWVPSPSIMRKTIDGTVYLIKKVTKDIK